ncbi:MAG: aminoglycoside 6-adenylyltransferase [Christensenellales bacterium]
MRSERQIMDTILSVVKSSDNIRAAYMNGSRTNPNVEKDELRDYDIVFSVNDVRRMINGRKWLKPFGDIAIMQEPDSVDMAWGENADLNKAIRSLCCFATMCA